MSAAAETHTVYPLYKGAYGLAVLPGNLLFKLTLAGCQRNQAVRKSYGPHYLQQKRMLFWECRESPVDLHIIMNLVHENQQSLFRGLRVAGNYTKMNAHWRALIAHWLFTHLLLVVSSHASQPCLWLTRLYCGQVSLNIICHNLRKKLSCLDFCCQLVSTEYLKGTPFVDSCPPLAEPHAVKSIER